MLKGRRGGDVIASLLAPCVTSAVNGEKEQPGSNNNHKKKSLWRADMYSEESQSDNNGISHVWLLNFQGQSGFFFFLLCSTQGEYDLKS